MRATNLAGSEPPRRHHRVQRYPLHLPVLYCRAGETQWHLGLTENISESGTVIRSDEAPAPPSRVTVVVALPSSDTTPGGWLIGKGAIVRNLDAAAEQRGSTFAVAAAFELARREDVPRLLSK